jgi:dolichol-phosphate mannosyltransferase
MKNICIIIPVYNEEKNIKKIFNKINKLKIILDILFIEDNSSDQTRNEILKLKNNNNNIYCIFRKKKGGIGSAHKRAIQWCYARKYKKIISMDSDGTHDPKYIPEILDKSNKYDIVITSRFSKKKSLSDWPAHRKFLTYLRLLICKLMLNIDLDASGAFRCFSTKKIELNDLIKIKSNHYDYFFESIYVLSKKKYLFYEVPIKLPYRKLGESKMNFLHIVISVISLLRIKFNIAIK